MHTRVLLIAAWVLSVSGGLSCAGLPGDVLFGCEPDGGCVPSGTQCWSDGYCHAGAESATDAGGPGADGGAPDAGAADAGPTDAGPLDAGPTDAGESDAGGADAGPSDAGTPDAGEPDAGGADAGSPDAGPADAGAADAGSCVPATVCPGTVECGYVDAGCGVELDCRRDCPAPLECGVLTPNACALPRLCTRGWCWENPLPQGNTLSAAWAQDARHAWFVGAHSTVVRWDGERSRLEGLPLTSDEELRAVHGSAATDVFVVGTGTTLLHFDGATWELEGVRAPGWSGTVNAVWATGGGVAFAGGFNTVLVRDPGQLAANRWATETVVSPPNEDFTALAATGTGELYAITATGKAWRRNPSTSVWSQELFPTLPAGTFSTATGVEGALLVGGAVGSGKDGLLRVRAADGGWQSSTLTGRGAVTGLWAVSSADTWVVTESQVLRFVDAGTPVLVPWVNDAGYVAVAGAGPNRAVVAGLGGAWGTVGTGGLVQRSGGDRRDVTALCGPGPEQLFAGASSAGTPAALVRTPGDGGVRWVVGELALPAASTLTGCFAQDDLAWLTASPGKGALKPAGSSTFSADFSAAVAGARWGAWGPAGGPYFFAREAGGRPYLDVSTDGGTATMSLVTLTPTNLGVPRAIAGAGPGDAVMVGTKTSWASLQADGGWSAVAQLVSGSTVELVAVHAAPRAGGGTLTVAVGGGSAWYRADAGAFGTAQTVAPTATLKASFVTPDLVWLLGNRTATSGRPTATLYRDDGQMTRATDVPMSALNVLWGVPQADGGTRLFVGGPGGALLAADPP